MEKDGEIIYSIEVTTNRVDEYCVRGIAREAAAILPRFGFHAKFINPDRRDVACNVSTQKNKLTIDIQDPEQNCQRILGVILDNVHLASSPKKISDRLETAGIRSLNNAVDITNYVMTEIGHPAHVFDYDRLTTKKLLIRKSKKGEKIISLEDKEYILPGGDIVIDDGTGKIIDLPGIIGTANSIVVSNTKRVLFFIETNDPGIIRNTSMSLGIRTVAATLNEKGVDPETAKNALLRGIELFKELCDAEVASEIYDIYPNPIKPKTVSCPMQKLYDFADEKISEREILSILNSLEIKSEIKNGNIISRVPSFRNHDINILEDIIEEVVRIYGYHNLKGKLPEGELPENVISASSADTLRVEQRIKELLKETNFTEVYTLSMLSSNDLENINYPCGNAVKINNPLLKEEEYMRPSLLPSLLKIVSENLSHEKEMAIFEMSNVYNYELRITNYELKNKNKFDQFLPSEKMMLGIVCVSHDFFEIKGKLEYIFKELGIISLRINNYGKIEYVENNLLQKYKISEPVLYIELDNEKICADYSNKKTFIPIPKFPEAYEDLSLIIPEGIYYTDIEKMIKQQSDLIKKVNLLDEYKDSLTLRVIYQSEERNIVDRDIKEGREKILKALNQGFKIFLKS